MTKYFCDCCGKEQNISEEYLDIKVELGIFTQRKPNIFTHGLSGSALTRLRQCLCDECKSKLIYELDETMKAIRVKYSLEAPRPTYDWGFSLLPQSKRNSE